jgi:hypothetical protein
MVFHMADTKSVPDLQGLNAGVKRARSERDRPLAADEGPRPVLPLVEYLDERGERAIWRAVAELGQREPGLYNRFVGERYLRDLIVDVTAEHDGPIDFPCLLEEVERQAENVAQWLIAVPLANLLVPSGFLLVKEDLAALITSVQDPDWTPHGSNDPQSDPFAMFRGLKDRLDGGVRWEREQGHRGRLDTRMTAKLVAVESGTETAALSVAVTRARLALAIWCLLDPPDPTTLWPTTGEWLPRAYVEAGIVHKPYEAGKWTGGTSPTGRWTTEFRAYTITDDPKKLAAPFEMMRLSETMIAPRAVASAAWALHLAERQPNDLERTDEVVHLRGAIEALCDAGRGPDDKDAEKRWGRITKRFGVWDAMTGLYGRRELKDAQQLARDLRNITQHGSDDILVNLGYPTGALRRVQGGRTLTSEELGLARAAAALPVLREAVRTVIRRLAITGIADGWDDERFSQEFA